MRITIELTPKLLEALSAEQTKEILLDLITPTPEVKELLIYRIVDKIEDAPKKIDVSNEEEQLRVIRAIKTKITTPVVQHYQKKLTKELLRTIKTKYEAGAKIIDLASEYDIKYSTVKSALLRVNAVKKKALTTHVSNCVQAHLDNNEASRQLAKQILDDKTNELKRVKGTGGLYPPITDELSPEVVNKIRLYYNLNDNQYVTSSERQSIQQIADNFNITIPMLKRIILNN